MNMKQPLISIIVPIYNVEQYLRRCVDSIINQTYQNIEIILVDDGSPDNCGKICDEYAKQDQRVKVIHKPNGGLSDARNVGIENSQGDYLMFIDSDDWIELNSCDYLLDLSHKNNSDIVIFGVNDVYDNGVTIPSRKGYIGLTEKQDIIKCMSYKPGEYGVFNYVCNKFFSARLFDGIKFPVGRLAEDQGTTYKLIHKANRIFVTDYHLYNYFQRGDSISKNRFNPKQMKDRIELRLERLDFLKKYYPEIVPFQTAQLLEDIHIGCILYDKIPEYSDFLGTLKKFESEHKKESKEFRNMSKKMLLYYYCYPLYYMYIKLFYK